jgi:hypothetical protein
MRDYYMNVLADDDDIDGRAGRPNKLSYLVVVLDICWYTA